jgi:hypothetical protein
LSPAATVQVSFALKPPGSRKLQQMLAYLKKIGCAPSPEGHNLFHIKTTKPRVLQSSLYKSLGLHQR